jgi:curved DNA-binding protein CbpA
MNKLTTTTSNKAETHSSAEESTEYIPDKPPVSMELYDVLTVKWSATFQDIKRAYRKKAAKLHPDIVGGESFEFIQLSEAYRILSIPSKRKLYHEEGITQDKATPPDLDTEGLQALISALQEAVISSNPLSGKPVVRKYKDSDLLEAIRKILHGKLEQKRMEIENYQELLNGFNSVHKRTKHKPKKGATPDFLKGALQQQISGIEHGIRRNLEGVDDINSALTILDDYGFDFAPPVTMDAYHTGGPIELPDKPGFWRR